MKMIKWIRLFRVFRSLFLALLSITMNIISVNLLLSEAGSSEDYYINLAVSVIMTIADIVILIFTFRDFSKNILLITGEPCVCIIDDIVLSSKKPSGYISPCIYRVICFSEDGRKVYGECKGWYGLGTERGKICRGYISRNDESNKCVIETYYSLSEDETEEIRMKNYDLFEKKYAKGYRVEEKKTLTPDKIIALFILCSIVLAGLAVFISFLYLTLTGKKYIDDSLYMMIIGLVFVVAPILYILSERKKAIRESEKKNRICVKGVIDHFVITESGKGKFSCEIMVSGRNPSGEEFFIKNKPFSIDNPSLIKKGDMINVFLSGKDYENKSIDIGGYISEKRRNTSE